MSATEESTITWLEKSHMTKRRRNIYLALDELDLDYTWDMSEVNEMQQLWNDGTSLEGIAEHFRRDPAECFILLFDLAQKSKIEYRKNSIFGGIERGQ